MFSFVCWQGIPDEPVAPPPPVGAPPVGAPPAGAPPAGAPPAGAPPAGAPLVVDLAGSTPPVSMPPASTPAIPTPAVPATPAEGNPPTPGSPTAPGGQEGTGECERSMLTKEEQGSKAMLLGWNFICKKGKNILYSPTIIFFYTIGIVNLSKMCIFKFKFTSLNLILETESKFQKWEF